jgi:hypothetical protein
MSPKQRPGRNGAKGAIWQRMVRGVVREEHGLCHLCLHFGAKTADHVIPITEAPEKALERKNIKSAHGYPHPCDVCSAAAGKPIYCNEIRGAYSIERARRRISELTGLKIGEDAPAQGPEGRPW